MRIYKTYGNDAVQLMSENPYRLAKDIRGIGFKTADAIASRLGIEKTAMIRVRAGISYALTEALNDGHCGLPVNELSSLAEKLLEVPAALIETAMALKLAEKTIVKDSVEVTECVFPQGFISPRRGSQSASYGSQPESRPGRRSMRPRQSTGSRPNRPSHSPTVRSRRSSPRSSKVLVMTGGPGVGKTTIVNSILRILKAKNVEMLLCAPTGRAAKRMSEATGQRRKRSIGCSRSIPNPEAFVRIRTIPSIPISSSSTKPP